MATAYWQPRTVVYAIGLFVLGIVLGGVIGIGIGLAYTELAGTTSFEGYSAMLVFFGFAPAGMVIGAFALPAWVLAWRHRRARRRERSATHLVPREIP